MKPGDKVHWVKISKKGRSISMRQLEGEIVAINGNTATIKYSHKGFHNTTKVALNELRPATEKGQLTEFVENLAAEYRKDKPQPNNSL